MSVFSSLIDGSFFRRGQNLPNYIEANAFKDHLSFGAWGSTFRNDYFDLSLNVSPIDEAIDIIARSFASGVPYLKDENGELSQDNDLVQFLLQPNKDQNFKEFAKEYIRNLFASGYSYLEPCSDNGAFVRTLSRLDREDRPELKALNTDYISYPNNRLDDFIYTVDGLQQTKNFTDMIPFWDKVQDPCNHRIGVSRMLSLRDEITNVILANRAKTNKIKQSGKFLATPKSSGLSNQIGLQLDQPVNLKKPDYKQRDFIEDKLENTGLASHGKSITVTNTEMSVMNVMESIQDYSYDDEIKEDKRTIKNDFGIPKELQNIGDDPAKYENRKEAYLELFTLNIIPLATNFTESIQRYYAPEISEKLVLDFSHHPAFEIIKNEEQDKKNSQVDMLINLFDKGIITSEVINRKLSEFEII